MTRRASAGLRSTAVALTAACVLLAACTTTTSGRGSLAGPRRTSTTPGNSPAPTSSAPAPAAGGSTGAGAAGCRTTYAAPDPNRPRMTLAFTVSPDHSTVTGTEKVVFRPDRAVTELVFRLTANTIPTVQAGNRIVVSSAKADHGAGPARFAAANAAPGTQGGLLIIPFAKAVAANTAITANIAFTVTLGRDSFDRFGRSGAFAYFGSAEPLLAWQRGFGWHTEDLIDFTAESATSEAMDVDLTVRAPGQDTVIMSGDPADPPPSSGLRTWRSRIAAARDVSVAAGPFAVRDTTVGPVKLRVGAYDAATRDALVPEFVRAIQRLSALLGPFPFPSLSVARLPAQGGGIEYPSSILMLDGSRLVAVHETAHQWFYAMVGNSQALDPWLDEAFAEYAEETVDGTDHHRRDVQVPGRVGASTESYGQNVSGYYFTTYNKGSAALEAARLVAGPAKWDAAIRCYVATNAWRIATPADLARALRGLPQAVEVLREAGALK